MPKVRKYGADPIYISMLEACKKVIKLLVWQKWQLATYHSWAFVKNNSYYKDSSNRGMPQHSPPIKFIVSSSTQ
jgi:hypothetical protein